MTLNCKLTWLSLRSRNINFYFEDQVKYSVVASLLHLEKKREICNLNKIYMGSNASEVLSEGGHGT